MKPAPIALFVYNRPDHARRTIESLARNELAAESDLIVFSDGPKDAAGAAAVDEVRRYLRTVKGFRSVTVNERATNAGLAASIIAGVTQVCGEAGRVIVLEDDMVTSRWFLRYMNEGLALYEHDEAVASLHGYCYPVKRKLPETFFLRGADCWGWAAWSRSWRQFEADGAKLLRDLQARKLTDEFDLGGAFGFTEMLEGQIAGRNNSWAVRWHASCFLNGTLTLYPGRTLVQNIGNDSSGTHSHATDEYDSPVASEPVKLERIPLEPSAEGRRAFAEFLRGRRRSFLRVAFASALRRIGGSR